MFMLKSVSKISQNTYLITGKYAQSNHRQPINIQRQKSKWPFKPKQLKVGKKRRKKTAAVVEKC